jgi:uncharacterized protein (TIGR02265 family)
MPADRLDLASRLAAATRHDTVRGFAINAAFELARQAADEATALLCDPAGTGKRADLTAYPVSDALPVLWALADRLERPLGGVEAAFEGVGRQTATGYLGSLRGKALLLLNGNPKAMLGQLPAVYLATVGPGQRYLAWPGEGRCQVELDHDFFPLAWHRGLIAACLDAAGASSAAVEGQAPGFMKAVFQVRWS